MMDECKQLHEEPESCQNYIGDVSTRPTMINEEE